MDNYNKKKPEVKEDSKKPKFNWYWMWGLLLLVILGTWFLGPGSEKLPEMNEYEFTENFIKEGKVEKVEIVNKEIVQVYLTKEAYEADTSIKKVSRFNLSNEKSAHYIFKISDLESF